MTFVPSSQCTRKGGMCFLPQFNSFVAVSVLVVGHVGYVLVIFLLHQMMKNRSPFSLVMPMKAYNLVQVFLSLLMTIKLAPFLSNGFFNLDGLYCEQIEFWIFVHYITKFLDMFDTVFMVLRGKYIQITLLHLYHHTTIGLLWGTLLHFGVANGTAFYGAWINSLVHAVMYFHYFWTSLGYRNPFKKYITQFQMAQFASCILHAVLVLLFDKQISQGWALLQLCYHVTLLGLFWDFYSKDRKRVDGSKVLKNKAT